jgi:hypothetical protein
MNPTQSTSRHTQITAWSTQQGWDWRINGRVTTIAIPTTVIEQAPNAYTYPDAYTYGIHQTDTAHIWRTGSR